jgi:hypothetical protein
MAKTDATKKIKELTDRYQELRNEMIDELIKVLPVNVVIKFSEPLYITRDYMTDCSHLSCIYDKRISPLVAMVVTPHKELIVLDGELIDSKKENDIIRHYYSEDIQEIVTHNDIELNIDVNFWFGIREIVDIPFSALYHIYQDYCMLDRKRIVLD